jgi:glucose/arabinose dehydrogenase
MIRTIASALCLALVLSGCSHQAAQPDAATPAARVAPANDPKAPAAPTPAAAPPASAGPTVAEEPTRSGAVEEQPGESVSIGLKAPEGWLQAPPDRLPPSALAMFVNPELQARIMVTAEDAGKMSATEELADFTAQLKAKLGVTAGKIQTSKDKKTAWCTAHKDDVYGQIYVRHLGKNDSVSMTFVSNCPKDNQKTVGDVVDALVKSAEVK